MQTSSDRAAHYLRPPAAGLDVKPNPVAYIATANRVEARPREWATYLNDFEFDHNLSQFLSHGGTEHSVTPTFWPTSHGIMIRLVGSGDELTRAINAIRLAEIRGVVDLRGILTGGHHDVDQPVEGSSRQSRLGLLPAADAPAADASVQELATRLRDLTGLADGQLARLFPGEVHRETYQRWRTGRLTNPTPANRRRLGTLVRLFDTAAAAAVHTRDWVRNPTRVDNLSPLELLVDGRLDEVEELLSELVPGPADDEITSGEGRPVTLDTSFPRFVPRAAEPAIDLAFDANEGREEFEDDIARDDDDA